MERQAPPRTWPLSSSLTLQAEMKDSDNFFLFVETDFLGALMRLRVGPIPIEHVGPPKKRRIEESSQEIKAAEEKGTRDSRRIR